LQAACLCPFLLCCGNNRPCLRPCSFNYVSRGQFWVDLFYPARPIWLLFVYLLDGPLATSIFRPGLLSLPNFVSRRFALASRHFYMIYPPTALSNLDDFVCRITPIYMSGTCLQALNTYSTSCDSSVQNPIIVSGPTSSAGQSISTSDSSGICNQAFSQSSTSLASAGSSSPFFSGTVTCAPSTLGYFYIQNNCPPTNESSIITIVVGGMPYIHIYSHRTFALESN
jgi:hypothetical protein